MALKLKTKDAATLASAEYWRIVHISIDPLRTGVANVVWGGWVDSDARLALAQPLITRTRRVAISPYAELFNGMSNALYVDLKTDPFFATAVDV